MTRPSRVALLLLALPLLARGQDGADTGLDIEALRMTGGGTVVAVSGERLTHAFQVRCDPRDPRQRLELAWGQGRRFHLLHLQRTRCSDELGGAQAFDTFLGRGTGRLDGGQEAVIVFRLTDGGEPGDEDFLELILLVTDPETGETRVALGAIGTPEGNYQAHTSP